MTPEEQEDNLDIETIKADFRLASMRATHRVQKEIGFGDQWRALVEHTIFNLMKDAYERNSSHKLLSR